MKNVITGLLFFLLFAPLSQGQQSVNPVIPNHLREEKLTFPISDTKDCTITSAPIILQVGQLIELSVMYNSGFAQDFGSLGNEEFFSFRNKQQIDPEILQFPERERKPTFVQWMRGEKNNNSNRTSTERPYIVWAKKPGKVILEFSESVKVVDLFGDDDGPCYTTAINIPIIVEALPDSAEELPQE